MSRAHSLLLFLFYSTLIINITFHSRALLLVALMVTGRSWSEPLVEEQIRFYSITGTSASEIRTSLDENSPIFLHDKRFDASTESDIQWNFRMRMTGGQCQLERVSTRLVLLFTLPELNWGYAISDELKNRWNRYFQALVRHEEGHALIALRAARQIESTLAQLPNTSNCEVLEARANELANGILQTYKSVDRRFDEKTMHGALDGAIFPKNSQH